MLLRAAGSWRPSYAGGGSHGASGLWAAWAALPTPTHQAPTLTHRPLAPPLPARLRSASQLYIKGVTPKPSRTLAPKAGQDVSATWVVMIKTGRSPTLKRLPPPNDPHPHSIWLGKGKNPNHPHLSATQYRTIVKDTLRGKGYPSAANWRRPRRTLNLLHDHDPAHTSSTFKRFAATYNINAELLPVRSPDLNPLDYGVFGPAQKKLEAELGRRRMTFEEQCTFLERTIQRTNTDAAIAALPQRIKRCIAAKGGHFE